MLPEVGRGLGEALPRRGGVTDSISRLSALFQQARTRVFIVSAFLGEAALDWLLGEIPDVVEETRVYARWSPEDIASGATDWRAWDVAKRHNVTLYACPGLHAKMYIADHRALVGSANATAQGLGLGGSGNLELLVDVDVNEPTVSAVLTETVRSSVEARPFGADTLTRDGSDQSGNVLGVWLPGVRPDVFDDAFRRRTSHSAQTRDTMNSLRLAESDGLPALREAVAETTSFRAVRDAFEGRLVPMYMDEILDLLETRVDARLRHVAREKVSLLVRWLGYFGSNTHLGTGPDGMSLALYPGERLTSIKVQGTQQ